MTQPNYCSVTADIPSGTLYKIEIDTLFSPTTIDENTFSEIGIYPNPGNDILYVCTNGFLNNGLISISDSQGRTVLSKPLRAIEGGLDVSALAQGIYFISLSDKTFSRTYKYIKL
mgnify:CR=1 FL=1